MISITLISIVRLILLSLREGMASLKDKNDAEDIGYSLKCVMVILFLPVYIVGVAGVLVIIFFVFSLSYGLILKLINEFFSLDRDSLLLTAVVLEIYFLPFTTSYFRRRPYTTATGTLNLLLGWTVIGWVIAMEWALTRKQNANEES